jgi:hypothetical protein
LNLVLDLQDTLVEHARAIAQAYVEQLFLKEALRLSASPVVAPDARVAGSEASAALPSSAVWLRELFERLRPLAIGSVSAAFPVVLQQEFEKALARRR